MQIAATASASDFARQRERTCERERCPLRDDRETSVKVCVGGERARCDVRRPRSGRASRCRFGGVYERERGGGDEQQHEAVAARFLCEADVVGVQREESEADQSDALAEQPCREAIEERKRCDRTNDGETAHDPFARAEMNPGAEEEIVGKHVELARGHEMRELRPWQLRVGDAQRFIEPEARCAEVVQAKRDANGDDAGDERSARWREATDREGKLLGGCVMRKPGLEPGRVTPLDPKSSASTNSATSAGWWCECGRNMR